MVDGLGDRLINRHAVARHSGARFQRQHQHATTQLECDVLVEAYRLGCGFHPPCDSRDNLLKYRIGHGFHQRSGVLPRAQHHVFLGPSPQCLAPSMGRPHAILCQIAKRVQAVEETGAADVTPRIFVERSIFRDRLREPLHKITPHPRGNIDVPTCLVVRITGATHPVGELITLVGCQLPLRVGSGQFG